MTDNGLRDGSVSPTSRGPSSGPWPVSRYAGALVGGATVPTSAEEDDGVPPPVPPKDTAPTAKTSTASSPAPQQPHRPMPVDFLGAALSPPSDEPVDYLTAGLLQRDAASPPPPAPPAENGLAQHQHRHRPSAIPAESSPASSPAQHSNGDVHRHHQHPHQAAPVPAGGGGGDGGDGDQPTSSSPPPGRRSVQFARENMVFEAAQEGRPAARHGSWDANAEGSGAGKGGGAQKASSFISKLKALATSTAGLQTGGGGIKSPLPPSDAATGGEPSSAAPSAASPTANLTTGGGIAMARVPSTLNEEHDEEAGSGEEAADADAEETADEGGGGQVSGPPADVRSRRKRRMRRRRQAEEPAGGSSSARGVALGESMTAPNTPARMRFTGPMTTLHGGGNDGDSPGASGIPHGSRLSVIRRRTMPDGVADDGRGGGMSEGEGRDRLARSGKGWRRGSSWITSAGGVGGRQGGQGGEDGDDVAESPALGPAGRRGVGHLRRISVFGTGGVSDGDAIVSASAVATPRRPFLTGERASTYGAAKWKQVKGAFKALRSGANSKRADENAFDYLKSAELMAELRAGAPAVLMLASMIQRDEHGNKRIPVLLEQLKLKIRDSRPVEGDDSERHWLFTIDLEYGSGPSRMKWTIQRTIREILNLHLRYRLALRNENYHALTPHAPHPRAAQAAKAKAKAAKAAAAAAAAAAQVAAQAAQAAQAAASGVSGGAAADEDEDNNTAAARANKRRPKQPRFPISAFPYLRGARGLDDDSGAEEDDDEFAMGAATPALVPGSLHHFGGAAAADDTAGEGTGTGTAAEGTASEAERVAPTHVHTGLSGAGGAARKKMMVARTGGGVGIGVGGGSGGILAGGSATTGTPRRRSTGFTELTTPGGGAEMSLVQAAKKQRFIEKQQRMLEKYLQEMIRWLMFRADSNRLCRFLELSALGVRLAAEGSYHGKECYLHIRSSKGLDFRRVLTPKKVIARHSRKWFLVRQSYVVCVESPENMNVYDVYLVDSQFKIVSKTSKLKQMGAGAMAKASAKMKHEATAAHEMDLTAEQPPDKHHTLAIQTSERKVKLFSRNQNLIRQFEESMTEMLRTTPWFLRNRFDSYAPVRHGVFAQWLVDGRDYMWNVSRAIAMARDVVYIHDWWLSPELYMRRPACISQKWRLDRLLQRKAKEGVKIFVIIYRNVEAAVPIDSEYTKFSLLNLHPNVFVQRSPNQFKKNQFFFAHHEKLVIVDHDVAFVGGIDLCFGRWDCPQHPVADDKPTGFEAGDDPKDAEHCQLFPGKDYSNPRVQDFFHLNMPYEEMYDRSKVPRMPWHDVGMQVVGQPARDLTRHFVQRWNYLRRGRKPTRPIPFLLPPPDARPEELEALGLTGTCEVQILRSASTWSLGIEQTEESIHTAYVKMIAESEHFVYMENQFFITSTETMNTRISNRVGDALVERIIRASENGEDWRCVILMPLMPGFQNTVDQQEGTSVRLILQCQFRSICRGENSIFGRLRAVEIDPEEYIQFFSLRQWGKIGPAGVLVTEQLYIHAKLIVVDDRVALIGSANINERSLVGSRDSEVAVVVRDTDMIWSTMAGRPYRVGRFAHGLRLRLMREHLGLDVDEILEEERQAELDREAEFERDMGDIYGDEEEDDSDESPWGESGEQRRRGRSRKHEHPSNRPRPPSVNHDVDLDVELERAASFSKGKEAATTDRARTAAVVAPTPDASASNRLHEKEVAGYGADHWMRARRDGADQGRDSVIVGGREVLVHSIAAESRGTLDRPRAPHELRPPAGGRGNGVEAQGGAGAAADEGGTHVDKLPPVPPLDRRTTEQLGLPRSSQLPTLPHGDDTDIGGPPAANGGGAAANGAPPSRLFASGRFPSDLKPADISKDCMRDPLNIPFYEDVWNRVADNNTRIYRRVFRCMPDSEVTTWHDYRDYADYYARFRQSMDALATAAAMNGKAQGNGNNADDAANDHQQQQAPAAATSAAPGVGAPATSVIPMPPAPKDVVHAISEKIHSHLNKDDAATPTPKVVVSDPSDAADNEKSAAVPPGSSGSAEKQPQSGAAIGASPVLPGPPSPVLREGGGGGGGGDNSSQFPALDSGANVASEKLFPAAPGLNAGTSTGTANAAGGGGGGSQRRRRRNTTKGSRRGGASGGAEEVLGKHEAEELLSLVQGNLVQFPYDWLLTEENNGNWLYQVDQVAPLQIYN